MTDPAVQLAATSLCKAVDVGVVNDNRDSLSAWLSERCETSPTAIALLLTALLSECLMAASTARREHCGDPGCPDCGDVPVDLTPSQIADGVMLIFNSLKAMLPANGASSVRLESTPVH